MTLQQFQDIRAWHLRHWQDSPREKDAWDMVLTLWLMGWVGPPAALMLDLPIFFPLFLSLLFVPGWYVRWRLKLHRRKVLRCDWSQSFL